MKQNSFECPSCGKYTEHVSLSSTEAMAIEKSNIFFKTCGIISDIIGVSKIVDGIFGGNWKCCKCGYAAIRTPDGKVHRYLGKG
jgi:rubrerythrin